MIKILQGRVVTQNIYNYIILQLQISYSVYALKLRKVVQGRQSYCNEKNGFWPTL